MDILLGFCLLGAGTLLERRNLIIGTALFSVQMWGFILLVNWGNANLPHLLPKGGW